MPQLARSSHLKSAGQAAACLAASVFALSSCVPARATDGLDGMDGYIASAGTDALGGGSAPPSATVDKSQYNLFNPTPDNLLRAFKTSRPDQTTGPGTVDAGHYYIELGLFENSINLGSKRSSAWIPLQSTHFRAGLTNTVEVELIYNGYYDQNTRSVLADGGRSSKTVDGSGDFTVRTRFNLIGDDGGPFSFGIIPQVTLPTATNHIQNEHVEGSVILPVSFKMPAGFSAIVHVQPGTARNAAKTSTLFELITGVTLYHDLARQRDHVEGYLEYFDTLDFETDGYHSQQVDVGVRWMPIPNWQLDFGCNFGVSVDAPDYQYFSGLSTRF